MTVCGCGSARSARPPPGPPAARPARPAPRAPRAAGVRARAARAGGPGPRAPQVVYFNHSHSPAAALSIPYSILLLLAESERYCDLNAMAIPIFGTLHKMCVVTTPPSAGQANEAPPPPRALNSRAGRRCLNIIAQFVARIDANDGRGRCATRPSAEREAVLLGGGVVARLLGGRGGRGGCGGLLLPPGIGQRGRAGGELDLVKEADVVVLREALLGVTQRLRCRGLSAVEGGGCGGARGRRCAVCVPCIRACRALYGLHALPRHSEAAVAPVRRRLQWAAACSSAVDGRLRPLGRTPSRAPR